MGTRTRLADASRRGPGTRSVKRSVLGAGVSTASPAPFMAERGLMRPKARSRFMAATLPANCSRRSGGGG